MPTHLINTFSFTIFFIWAISKSNFMIWASTTSSIYDALESHGLPKGLFPKGIMNYSLAEDGVFELHLDQACNAQFESKLHYEKDVSGQLKFGQIRNLTGMSAQDLFLWFPVKGIRVDIPTSGVIYFDVGVVFKQFPLSLFETPPDCVASTDPLDVSTKKLSGNLRYRLHPRIIAKEVM